MNQRDRVHVRIRHLRLLDPRIVREVEDALDASARGNDRGGTSPAAAAIVARIVTELGTHQGDDR